MSSLSYKNLTIYTDGACSGNPGPGGWAFVIPELNIEQSGYDADTTNNRMEITAIYKALKYLYDHLINLEEDVEIITDSQYVINTMTQGWKKNKNKDLWACIDYYKCYFTNIKWTWVKGHADNEHNKRCDELAVLAYTTHNKEQTGAEETQLNTSEYCKKDTILGVENISISFRPHEKYIINDTGEYVILYQSMWLDYLFVVELNGKELIAGGTYADCMRVIQHFKYFVGQQNEDLPF